MAGPGGAVIKSQRWDSDSDLFNAKGGGGKMGRVSTSQNRGEGDFEKRWLECGDITARVSFGRSSELLGKRL